MLERLQSWLQGVLGTRRRIALLATLAIIALGTVLLQRWVIRSVLEPDSWRWQSSHYANIVFWWLGILIGPLWAVFEDRRTEHPWIAALRGYAFSVCVLDLPNMVGMAAPTSPLGAMPVEIKFKVCLFLVAVCLIVALPYKRSQPGWRTRAVCRNGF
ncbi:hypothetical protein BH11ARM2_BH11ARM2_08760 [soil metagenome]